ncbi:GNAT family N-acetyltransferase [Candidatus Saccharibacteria bacterium]|nr:GNAT family N-acetyltransferase [Candidatus Saccharibacteria bacterium]
MQTKTTDGLVIRMQPILESEMAAVPEPLARYEVCAHLSLRGAQNHQQELDWLKARYDDPDSQGWGIYEFKPGSDSRGRLIGASGIENISSYRGISGVVLWDSGMWGKGIASAIHRARCLYAVDVLGLVAIDSGADLVNQGSHRALCGVGYVKTGVDYNRGVAYGKHCHAVRLLWVNPSEYAWNFFWAGGKVPKHFVAGRVRAQNALDQARKEVEFL